MTEVSDVRRAAESVVLGMFVGSMAYGLLRLFVSNLMRGTIVFGEPWEARLVAAFWPWPVIGGAVGLALCAQAIVKRRRKSAAVPPASRTE